MSFTRARGVVRACSRRSFGSELHAAEWRESSLWTLTSNVKPSGVTSTQRSTVLAAGTA